MAFAISPCMTLFIAAGSCPSSAFELVFEPAGGRQADDRRQVERESRSRCGPAAFGENAADQRLRRFCRADAVRERLQERDNEAAFGSLTPSMIEKPTIANTLSTCGICFSSSLDAADRLAGAGDRGAVRQLHETKNAPWSSSGRNPVGVRNATGPDRRRRWPRSARCRRPRHPHQAAHDRRIAVADVVDAPQYPAHRAAPRRRDDAERSRTAPATKSAHSAPKSASRR